MAGLLRDIQPGRVYVDCSSCKRSGRYTVASLRERFGPDMSTLDVLRTLTASCRYQRPPGSPPAWKYEHLCLAAITLPPPMRPTIPVPPSVSYTVEVWTVTGGRDTLSDKRSRFTGRPGCMGNPGGRHPQNSTPAVRSFRQTSVTA
ncbi:hypothetical protein [Methylobacterium sp. ARG-1]|uniref:hypothetical protein n=1 Tax=Methylobacterium sp. ARG-1 TaxID=1692501 RepID=UPI0019103D58|nr:hypothetical protein [Methylobacterium sp. ARG-1]